jgi:hypothetical protein
VPRLCSGWTPWMAGSCCRMDLWEGHGITPMQHRWFSILHTRATTFMDGSLVCCSSVHFCTSCFEMHRLVVLFRMKEEEFNA